MLTKPSIGSLVHHEVLSLDQHQVAQKWSEEQWAHHADDQAKVEHDLGGDGVVLDYSRDEAGGASCVECVVTYDHVDVYRRGLGHIDWLTRLL